MIFYLRLPGATPLPKVEPKRPTREIALSSAQEWMRDTWQMLGVMVGRRVLITAGLVVGLLASSVGSVYTVHESRARFVELEALVNQRDALEAEWSRLLLEESAWSAHARIEQLAGEKYGLRIPDPAQVEVIR